MLHQLKNDKDLDDYPNTASLKAFAGLIFMTVLAGILIGSPVAGFLPILAFLLTNAVFPMPGNTNEPFFLVFAKSAS